jgi:isopenicillin-N epimerase
VRKRNHDLVLEARAVLCEALGVEPPAPEDMIASLASVPLPPSKEPVTEATLGHEPLQKALFEEDRIEVPIHLWPAPPKRLIRISAQLYNSIDQYETLAAALKKHLGACAR